MDRAKSLARKAKEFHPTKPDGWIFFFRIKGWERPLKISEFLFLGNCGRDV